MLHSVVEKSDDQQMDFCVVVAGVWQPSRNVGDDATPVTEGGGEVEASFKHRMVGTESREGVDT